MKNYPSLAGSWKSVRFVLAFALLLAVGSVGFYACTSKNTQEQITPSTKTTTRNNKSGEVLINMQVPTSLRSTTQIVDRVESRTITHTDERGTVTGVSQVSFDAENRVVKMELSKSIVDYFEISDDEFIGIEPIDILAGACSCATRRDYWYNYRIKSGWNQDSAQDKKISSFYWDITFGLAFGCAEADVPGGC